MRQLILESKATEVKPIDSQEPIRNLLHAIEVVVDLSENSNLSPEFFAKAKRHIDYICNIQVENATF
jgi:hypothetical protein